MRCAIRVLVLCVFLCVQFTYADLINNKRLYGYIYWENGLPLQDLSRFPDSWANPDASVNPNLIVQTGYYNLRFDMANMANVDYVASAGSDYLSALTEDASGFADGSLLLRVYKNDIAYTARSAVIEEAAAVTAYLVENGQYVQRFYHTGLIFTDNEGNELTEKGYFEVTAWPDRVVFTLDFSDHANVTRTTIQVTSPNGTKHLVDRGQNKINLAFEPQNNSVLTALNPETYITDAYHQNTGEDVPVTFDTDEYALRLDIAPSSVTYPQDKNIYDEYVFEVTNPTNTALNVPLVFNQTSVPKITGTVMTLVEEDDGRPTGTAVQISKNWHKTAGYTFKHQGSWLRGSSMVTVAANSTKTLRLRVIYGYWGEVGTASHAQLSLIGYSGGTKWQWDESALGAWGETMTFDPLQTIAGAFIADVRPSFTTPMNASYTDHGWTENVGGGDFLIYYDNAGKRRWSKKLKTAYRWTGPNMTEVLYSGVTDDDAIRFTYTTQLVASNDYNRRFQHYEYEILKDISPSRLSYYQMGADYYNTVGVEQYYLGLPTYITHAMTPDDGGNEYKNRFSFTNLWLMSNDQLPDTSANLARSNRGLIWRDSKLNGSAADVYLHSYGRTWGSDTTLFEVSGSSTSQSYSKGTIISGELEYVMPAKSSDEYWGYDTDFNDRLLSANNSKPWSMVQQEQAYNSFDVNAAVGTLEKSYPIVIQAGAQNNIIAYFTVPANAGIGHIPVVVKEAPAGLALRVQYKVSGSDTWEWAVENTSHITQNEYYQGYANANGTMDYAFNIARPLGSLSKSITVRVFW